MKTLQPNERIKSIFFINVGDLTEIITFHIIEVNAKLIL